MSNTHQVTCFIDDDPDHSNSLEGLPVYHGSRIEETNSRCCSCCNRNSKWQNNADITKCRKVGIEITNIIHPSAYIAPSVKMGNGNFIKARAVIETKTVIGDGCIIDNGVTIAHDNVIGNGCHIAPGVAMGSSITIGDLAIIGIGASLTTNLSIGTGALISVGSSVTKDVPQYSVVEGVPGKIVGKMRQ